MTKQIDFGDLKVTPTGTCDGCPWRATSDGFVMGAGKPNATLLVVGEAPGKKELLMGEPFVGASGIELNHLLGVAGISRSEAYITNVCKCLPKEKTPSHAQAAECISRWLKKEVEEHNFKYVLALGKFGAQAFQIPQARKKGPAHGYILNRGTYAVMSTWHPAYILRTQYLKGDTGHGGGGVTARAEAQHDLIKFSEFMRGELPLEMPPPHMAPFDQVGEVLHDPTAVIAVDIETTSLDKFHNEIGLIGFAWRKDGQIYMTSGTPNRSIVSQVLAGPALKVYHNINFDVGVLKHSANYFITPTHTCTSMLGSLLASDLPKGLEFMVRAYLNTAPWKWTQEVDKLRYNAIDCWTTLRLYEEFTNKWLPRKKMMPLKERCEQALRLSVQAHLTGVRVDMTRMKVISHVMQKKISQAEEELDALAYKELSMKHINWNSSQQVTNLLYDRLKLPKQLNSQTGKPTADASALEELASLHPIPKVLRTYKTLSKLISTYLNPNLVSWPDGKQPRLFPEFLMDTTSTGRFSSRGPNFQNQPRGGPIKQIYLPDKDDHYFVDVDFSQIEMRVMVYLSEESRLMEAYEKGYDIHTYVAQMVFEKEEIAKEERHMAKYIVYGLGYGRGAASVAQQYGWPISKAKTFVDTFAKRFPRLWEWRRAQFKQAERDRMLTNPFNRRRYFYGHHIATKAYNFQPQSTALDILIDGMIRLNKEVPEWRQMIWVHDSYCLSIPKKDIEEAKNILPQILGTCSLGFPTPIDLKYGPSWGNHI